MKGTDHDTTVVPAGDSKLTCVSCHRAHAAGKSSRMVATKRGEGLNPASGRCLSCHDGSTDATDPGPGSHPSKEDRNKEERAREAIYDGPIPFFTPAGLHTNDLANAEPACSTCHNPHQWSHSSKGGEGAADGDLNNSFLRDSKLVVQLCSRCHGKETGLKNFRNFHDQTYRDSRDVW